MCIRDRSTDDAVVRLGGDEFFVLLLEPENGVLEAVVKRVQDRLGDPVKLATGQPLTISAAVGQASTNSGVLSIADLLRDGDRSMYRAKHAHSIGSEMSGSVNSAGSPVPRRLVPGSR